ncbi:uncharacterized protein LOC135845547 [Planococcus citri]|uniref:uncharacterized protein LOC135845547 n=1 Tax=Planococcus citri TaxID=170843 RepID=UPI0031FA1B1F
MSSGDNSEVPVDHQKPKNLVRSQFYDVMVKVDADVYCLDRLQLAWKSEFFEKLFNEQSDQKECSLIELPVMDTKTFSAIVDIIYGQSLTSVLNHDNYVALLMAMNHLQMEIDMETYASYIEKNSVVDVKLFKLLNFLQENPNVQYLLPAVFKSLSAKLVKIQHNEDFLRLPLDDIIRIITSYSCALKKKYAEKEIEMHMATMSGSSGCPQWMKEKLIYSDNDIDMPTMSQICSQWIHHDLQSRLPHFAKLVNAVKRRICHVSDIKDDDFNTVLTGIAEEMNPEMTKKLFYKLVICDGEIESAPQESPKDEKKEVPIDSKENKRKKLKTFLENHRSQNYDFDDNVMTAVEKEVPIDKENERKKLKTLLENHRFHDIVVTTGEKAYKLHRFKLNSASGYFAEIFSAKQSNIDAQFAEASTLQQIKSNEYSLLGVDQATCDMIVEYIYFDELQLTSETIIPVFKAATTLKMEKLLAECVSWMMTNSKFLREAATADTMPLCFISFDILEELLLSWPDHCCDDPHRILDMCSKWVFHDVKNRYHLIPKIALAINGNRIMKYHDYKIELPTDSNNCSEKSIRNELWKTLNFTSLIPSAEKMPRNNEKKLEEMPVFIAWTRETSTIYVLNANMEQIAMLRLLPSSEKPIGYICGFFNIAATLVDDNLFIMFSSADYARPVFNVYNLSSKKFISLNRCITGYWSKCVLLNCRSQVLCCIEDGRVLKYSIELNRWIIISEKPSPENRALPLVRFTSDGDKLYRLYLCINASSEGLYLSKPECKYVVDEFNFQQNAWLPLSHLSFSPSTMMKNLTYTCNNVLSISPSDMIVNFTITNGSMLTVILPSCYMTFDQNSKQWHEFPMTDNILTQTHLKSFAVVQFGNELLHVCLNKLYQWSRTNLIWDLKKELPLRLGSELSDGSKNRGPYDYISAIHGHRIRTD